MRYEAPAKVNLSLLVSPPRSDGFHPLESLVQTVEWCDLLDVEPGQEGRDSIVTDIEDNIVERALVELRKTAAVPPLAITLDKQIPIAAGLGGGSSDAAAVLMAGTEQVGVSRSGLADVAAHVGSDVALFLTVEPLSEFAVAIVVPDFGLSTADVYQRWDALEGPVGDPVPDQRLPPTMRGGMPMRNDLLPAALDFEPRLGDFIADIGSIWGSPVCLTGSGSACFGYFATLDEATDAAFAVSDVVREGRGVGLRGNGVRGLDDRAGDEAR
jgi:4-diphosphocytidyl-2-C-methyl-D-erythritol kinase